MMKKKALITDGTNCIGFSFAMKMASLGMDLILIGAEIIKLKKVKEHLRNKFNVHVDILLADLTNYKEIERVSEKIRKIKNIQFVINCTGYCSNKSARKNNHDEELENVHANITAYSNITKAILPKMIDKNSGTIIFVSSQLAFSPFLKNSIYSESKDFVNIFAEMIQQKVKNSNIKIQSLNPGVSKSLFYNSHRFNKGKLCPQHMFTTNINEIVECSFDNLGKNLIVIPGWRNKLLMHFKKFVTNVII